MKKILAISMSFTILFFVLRDDSKEVIPLPKVRKVINPTPPVSELSLKRTPSIAPMTNPPKSASLEDPGADDLYELRNSSPEALISMANQIQMEIYSDEMSLERIQNNRSEEDFSNEQIQEATESVEKQKQRLRIILDFIGSENYYQVENKAFHLKLKEESAD